MKTIYTIIITAIVCFGISIFYIDKYTYDYDTIMNAITNSEQIGKNECDTFKIATVYRSHVVKISGDTVYLEFIPDTIKYKP